MGLDFHPVGLDDAATMRRLFEEDPPEISDFAFGYEFAYSRSANLKGVFATVAGCGIFGWNENNSPSFSAPFGGGNKRAAVEAPRDGAEGPRGERRAAGEGVLKSADIRSAPEKPPW